MSFYKMSYKKTKIKDLPVDQRPREKLFKYGAEKLSDTELLAILIRAGTPQKNVIEVAQEILNKYQSFKGMAGKSVEEIMEIKGIGKDKAVTIAAAFEIARRIVNQILEEKND